jgi:hypothetical protein
MQQQMHQPVQQMQQQMHQTAQQLPQKPGRR